MTEYLLVFYLRNGIITHIFYTLAFTFVFLVLYFKKYIFSSFHIPLLWLIYLHIFKDLPAHVKFRLCAGAVLYPVPAQDCIRESMKFFLIQECFIYILHMS